MSRNRSWCFTLNNPESNEIPIHESERYIIWQRECGESGTTHLQGYIELSKPTRLNNMVTWLRGAHFEVRRGTRDQAREYCRKGDSRVEGPWERGSWDSGGPGTRNDLLAVKRRLDDGATEKQIADEFFGEWSRHYKAFREYKRLKTEHRTWKTEVIVYHGAPGTGKSRKALEEAPKAYFKQRGNWWDGYEGQSDVVIDDYYGWLPFDTLLRLLDRYPMIVETKGGHAEFVAKRIIITSNKPPEEWYTNENLDIRALLRRIDQRIHFN